MLFVKRSGVVKADLEMKREVVFFFLVPQHLVFTLLPNPCLSLCSLVPFFAFSFMLACNVLCIANAFFSMQRNPLWVKCADI